MKRTTIGGVAALGLLATGAAVIARRHAATPAAAMPQHRIIFATAPEKPGDVAALAARADAAKGDAVAWSRLGNAQLAARAFVPAIASYKRSLAIDADRAEVWSALGEAYIQSERSTSAAMPAGARDAFDRALALDAANLRARFYKTMERDFAGQHDRAVGEWLQMLREAPMGSEADEAIRAALTWSINRNLGLVKAEMSRAVAAQPRVEIKGSTSS